MISVPRWVKWAGLGLVVAILIAAAVLYWMASRVPEAYRPLALTEVEQRAAVKRLGMRLQEFGNESQRARPFTWTIREDELNTYLSSLDAIVAHTPRGQAGQVSQAMRDAGFAEPVIDLREGGLTFMIRAVEQERIVSADVGIDLRAAGVHVALRELRVGALPVPRSLLIDRLDRVAPRTDAAEPANRAGDGGSPVLGGLSRRDVAALAAELCAALVQDRPADAELTWPVGDRRVRITEIRATDDALTLALEPADEPD